VAEQSPGAGTDQRVLRRRSDRAMRRRLGRSLSRIAIVPLPGAARTVGVPGWAGLLVCPRIQRRQCCGDVGAASPQGRSWVRCWFGDNAAASGARRWCGPISPTECDWARRLRL